MGHTHFYCHLKDGVQSFLQGFAFIILFEIPIMHEFLHYVWSPMAANTITALTIFSFAYLIAQYRAIEKRPISFTDEQLIIRYELYNPLYINLRDIKEVSINNHTIARKKHINRFNLMGAPNVKLEL
jgi:hypothetical protein